MLFFRYILGLLQLIMAPVKSWEDVSCDGYDARKLTFTGFFPLLVIMSLTVLLSKFYYSDTTWFLVINQLVISFAKYFVTYYIASFFFSLYMPLFSDSSSEKKNHTYIAYTLGLLVLFEMLQNSIPLTMHILYLLPLYVLYIMSRGVRYMAVKFDYILRFVVMSTLTIAVPPYLINWIYGFVVSH